MNKTFNLLFYVKKAKAIANGTAPIYLRITIDGKQTEIAAKRYISPEKWNNQAQKVVGTNEETKALNAYLKTLEQQVYDAQHEMLKDKKIVTTETIKAKLTGQDKRELMLVPIFLDHNQKMKSLIGNEFSPNTLKRYVTTLKHTINFLKWKYNITDIEVKAIDNAFVNEFEFYLRSVCNIQNNSAVKYVRNSFGKVIRTCIINGWLDKDPFLQYTSKVREVNRVFLTEDEVQRLSTKDFKIERLNQVRDIFVFSCYTGLAYIDAANLTPQNIAIGMDGEKWIYTFRQKTDTSTNIPVLPPALVIIEKYKEHQLCKVKNKLLPILSNQKMNAYLKKIAALCNINKEFTFHIARHTFATTVTLSNGIPIETVSKMLGHSSIKQTQHYAKILDRKVSDDMQILREKLSIKNTVSNNLNAAVS
jgi:site-specific recombinase XerD